MYQTKKDREYRQWVTNKVKENAPDNVYYRTEITNLFRLSKQIHRIDEQDCNGYQDYQGNWDEAAELREDKRRERLLTRAAEYAKRIGYTIYHQGDPRGCSLYLIPAGETENIDSRYNSIGIAIPSL